MFIVNHKSAVTNICNGLQINYDSDYNHLQMLIGHNIMIQYIIYSRNKLYKENPKIYNYNNFKTKRC